MSQYPDPNYHLPPNPLATWALVLGIIALILSPVIAGGVIGLVALALGILAARRESGKGKAIAGIILAVFAIAFASIVGLISYKIYHIAGAAGAFGGPADEAERQVIAFEVAINRFELDTDRYPTNAEGFKALTTEPADLKGKWHGPYIDTIPDDPWGHPYSYAFPGKADPEQFDITSNGPDGVAGTKDDITRNSTRP